MKTVYAGLGIFCMLIGLSGLFTSTDWGEVMQFFILAALCFEASGRK